MEEINNKELAIIQEVENKVTEITKFDVTKQQLIDMVAETKQIVATDLEDQMQLDLVKRNRIDLRNIEIRIEKRGKSYRDIFTKANRYIKEKEEELLAVTHPEIERLKGIEAEADVLKLRKERIALLPMRREKLVAIGDNLEVDDETLISMDGSMFQGYCNERLSAKLEKDRLALEEQRKAQEADAEIKRLAEETKLEAERKRIADEAEAKRQEAQAKIDAENVRLALEQKKIDDANAEIARKQKEAEDKARLAEEARVAAEKKAADDAEKARLADEAKKIEDARQMALRPDKEKLILYADALVAVKQPELNTEEARNILANAQRLLTKVTESLRK